MLICSLGPPKTAIKFAIHSHRVVSLMLIHIGRGAIPAAVRQSLRAMLRRRQRRRRRVREDVKYTERVSFVGGIHPLHTLNLAKVQ